MEVPVLACGPCVLRPWRREDLESLVRHADNPNVARGLRDRFPNPYTRADGEWFLDDVRKPRGEWRLAIEVDGAAVGGVGVRPGEDVHRISAEIGYWLGEAYWGRGIAPAMLTTVVPHAMQRFELCRISAGVYHDNPRSMRALEKAGFEREGTLRCAAIKQGRLLDLVMYSRVRHSLEDPP